jgi:integrase
LALPEILVDELCQHIDRYAGPGPEGLVFCGPKGAPLRRGNFGRSTKWKDVAAVVGLPADFHFHDLRHTDNQLAAASGATIRELMHRMGHGSMRAALIYQHATSARDRSIASALSALVATQRPKSSTPSEPVRRHSSGHDGQAGAHVPVA